MVVSANGQCSPPSQTRSPKDHKEANGKGDSKYSFDPHLSLRRPTNFGKRPYGAKEIANLEWPHVIEFRISLITPYKANNEASTGQCVNQSSWRRGTVQNPHGVADCAVHLNCPLASVLTRGPLWRPVPRRIAPKELHRSFSQRADRPPIGRSAEA
jgi:hypothetical protein